MATVGRGSPRAMRLFEASTSSPDLREMIKSIEASATDQVRMVLEFVRKDVLYFLKSYTDVMVPPRYQRKFTLVALGNEPGLVRVKVPKTDRTGWRPAHPGGWADVSDDLRKKYYTDLVFEDGAWKLTIGNNSDHAVFVEARDGLFVVHGVLEPNGPVARSIKKALAALGVPWKVGPSMLSAGAGVATATTLTPRNGVASLPTLGEL